MDLNASPEPEEPHNGEDNANNPMVIQRTRRRRRPDHEPFYHRRDDDGYHQFKRHRPNLNSKLPPGWLDCPAVGQEIGCLIPSKVPLGESFDDFILPGRRYSYRQVIHQQRVLGRKLGMVIDLTNSRRYYNPVDWKRDGMEHVKITCTGRDSVPENEAVNKFFYEVSRFLEKPPQKYILLHCTHGHNRTGYMIVHYLMRTRPVSVTQAIQIFADARPPGIYKPDYIDALYDFYHETKPDMVVCPPTPEWKRSSDLDLNGGDDDGDAAAPLDEGREPQLVMTNDDILGDKIPPDQEIAMRQFCYQSMKLIDGVCETCGVAVFFPCYSCPVCRTNIRPRGPQRFPGSHPVSLNWENLQLLRQRYYYATWKADGTRSMMLITMDGCYLIDRHFNFRRVQMRFPCRLVNDKGAEKMFHHLTLLDGEMVIDTVPESKKQERRYLIYDIMAINQLSVVERPFLERWKMIETEVIEPRNYERQQMHQNRNSVYIYDMEPFRVRRKDFWLLSAVTKVLKGFIPKLPHAADGLVFQGWEDPYVPRTHEGLLKWKYPEMNSVDFLFEMIDNRPSLYLFERGKKKFMGNRVVFPDGSDATTYSCKIIECSWDSGKDVWVCMRVRPDKGTPNEFNTYRKVMTSNITEDVLLNEINQIVGLPMYADRIQHRSKPHNSSRRIDR